MLNAVQPPAEQNESPSINRARRQADDAWSAAYGATSASSSEDPASRFISALDTEVQSVKYEEDATSSGNPASTWEASTPAFTPPPPSNWSYSAGVESEPETDNSNDNVGQGSTWQTPSTWAEVAPTTGESEDVDAAGFTDDGDDEIDYLSGDENIEVSDESTPELLPDEARDKAIALADELRRTIRMMSSGGESDHGAAVMALTEASLHVGDFSDVRGVLADVRNDPRDIQSLGELAAKVDRIDALLEEHRSLSDAIETAIREMNGF